MKYVILCNRHDSIFGENFCLFWGCLNDKGGYTSDIRLAHRFTEKQIQKFNDNDDIPISCELLGIPLSCNKNYNKSYHALIEKGTVNILIGLNLREK